jgi:hypothetical protein
MQNPYHADNIVSPLDELFEWYSPHIAHGIVANSVTSVSVAPKSFPVLSSSINLVRVMINGEADNLSPIEAAFDTCASSCLIRRDVLPVNTVV